VQCGTPREIFKAPANDYVSDFVSNMNPLGVLRAHDVMEPVSEAAAISVGAEDDIRSVMAQLDQAPVVGVVRDGAAVGQITRDVVLRRLLDPRG